MQKPYMATLLNKDIILKYKCLCFQKYNKKEEIVKKMNEKLSQRVTVIWSFKFIFSLG